MALRQSTGLKNALLGEVGLKAALADGVIYVYSGAQPVSADAAAPGSLLGRVTVNGGAFTHGAATNGLELDAPADGIVSKAAAEVWQLVGSADGTAGWFRFVANDGSNYAEASVTAARLDGSVSRSGGGGDMLLSSTTIVNGATTTLDVFKLTL